MDIPRRTGSTCFRCGSGVAEARYDGALCRTRLAGRENPLTDGGYA